MIKLINTASITMAKSIEDQFREHYESSVLDRALNQHWQISGSNPHDNGPLNARHVM